MPLPSSLTSPKWFAKVVLKVYEVIIEVYEVVTSSFLGRSLARGYDKSNCKREAL